MKRGYQGCTTWGTLREKLVDVQEERTLLEVNAKYCIRNFEGREDWG
jgi:hypothetical protein